MIPNTSDGSGLPPRLRCYFNLMALEDDATVPPGPPLEVIRQAGYDGVQFIAPAGPDELRDCERLGLGRCGLGRVNTPAEALPLAQRLRDEGMECGTLHIGWGIEDDRQAAALIEAVLAASRRTSLPLYVETHRATLFQDMWRAVQFVERFPELRFNGDFSHWYTGQEMVYGEFGEKLAFVQPVLDRVRFLHGRIGNPGSMQVDIGEGDESVHPYVGHFRQLWRRAFRGFLDAARAGDYILFVPELLSPRIYYARPWQGQEECSRWSQAAVLVRIARECFEQASGN
jgi:hypothetical protein